MNAYEFACEHLFSGCTTRINGDSAEEVARRAAEHLRSHHDSEPLHQPDVKAEMWKAIIRLSG